MKKRITCLMAFFGLLSAYSLEVSDVTARQRWPWNNLVDVDFVITTDGTEKCSVFSVDVTGTYSNGTRNVFASTFTTSIDDAKAGANRVTWNMGADYPGMRINDLTLTMTASEQPTYLVIDLSGGASADSFPIRYSSEMPNIDDDTCRTTELWMRRIPAGTYTMGSPVAELGRQAYNTPETQHSVTLTRGFYIGIFEVTQQQWFQVYGSQPSWYNNAACWSTRPVESISYGGIRGWNNGTRWPASSAVDANSFLGRLRQKAGVDTFDLPTESQWEYACRAGTTTALYNEMNLTHPTLCENLTPLARYKINAISFNIQSVDDSQGTAKVGSYLPNAWGLYDMSGNVWEYCRDWHATDLDSASVQDPKGPFSGTERSIRGGGCWDPPNACRSAMRNKQGPNKAHARMGFRIITTFP